MKLNRIGYYIKEGVDSVFTHGFMSFASVCTIVACLLIMGSFSLLALNVGSIINSLEDDNQILAYVDENLSEADARALETEIEAVDNVVSADFISRDTAMENFVKQYEKSELLEGLDSSVLRHRYLIRLNDISLMERTQNDVAAVNGIAKVNAHLEISRGFIAIRNIVLAVSAIFIAVLLIISLFIISNTIKLTTVERREEIAIMKMVGASNSFIRGPFMVEGLILGMTGACIAFLAQWGLYMLIYDNIISHTTLSFLMVVIPFGQVAVPMFVAFAAVGFVVGMFGSVLAIKNYLKV